MLKNRNIWKDNAPRQNLYPFPNYSGQRQKTVVRNSFTVFFVPQNWYEIHNKTVTDHKI